MIANVCALLKELPEANVEVTLLTALLHDIARPEEDNSCGAICHAELGAEIAAKMLADAGCFALVLEKIPATLAQEVAKSIDIPVIGIGAGVNVDGQVLVYADMLGMTADFKPKFLRRYADLNTIITDAVGSYVSDVKACDFPNENEQY